MKINNNNYYCVIGIGNHAYSKLIPSLEKSGKKIIGLVSRSNNSYIRKYKRYRNIDQAIINLPKNTVFVVSTPPNTHYYFIKKLLKKNKNLIIEKPIFTSLNQIKSCKKFYFSKNNTIFIKEAFMYRYTLMYKKSISFIKNEFNKIETIMCNFVLPSNPPNSFRDQKTLDSSCLYDIGSYIFDFFVSLDVKISSLDIVEANFYNSKLLNLSFSFKLGHIKVYSKIGIGNKYTNSLITKTFSGKEIEFSNFFYGRSSKKIIKNISENTKFVFYDKNSFTKMFRENDKMKCLYKPREYYKLYKINKILLELSNKLSY